MVMFLKKIRVTSVRDRTLILTQNTAGIRQCSFCAPASAMIAATAAVNITGHSLRTICRACDAGQIHFVDSEEGLFVCLATLTKWR